MNEQPHTSAKDTSQLSFGERNPFLLAVLLTGFLWGGCHTVIHLFNSQRTDQYSDTSATSNQNKLLEKLRARQSEQFFETAKECKAELNKRLVKAASYGSHDFQIMVGAGYGLTTKRLGRDTAIDLCKHIRDYILLEGLDAKCREDPNLYPFIIVSWER